jgi:hypothetical protein
MVHLSVIIVMIFLYPRRSLLKIKDLRVKSVLFYLPTVWLNFCYTDTPWTYAATPLDVQDEMAIQMVQEFLEYLEKNPRKNILQALARCSKLIGDIYYRSGRDQKLLDTLEKIRNDLLSRAITFSQLSLPASYKDGDDQHF